MTNRLTIAVFCGSRSGHDQCWMAVAQQVGHNLGKAGHRLVYGGGKTGLMGALANAALAEGGHVTGVLPRFLNQRELAHEGISNMVLTRTIHERKSYIYNTADAFVALPGGLGTLDEVTEVMIWKSLGRHNKPLILVDTGNFWHHLMTLCHHFEAEGFLHHALEQLVFPVRDVGDILPNIERLCAPCASASPSQTPLTSLPS